MQGCDLIRKLNFSAGRRAAKPFVGRRSVGLALTCLVAFLGVRSAQAAVQFDVFMGYGGTPTGMDGVVRGMTCFPIACEIHHDGPSFAGTFEVSASGFGSGQIRRFRIELPTNTRKRFVIPVLPAGGGGDMWEARLLDERGRVVAEHTMMRPKYLSSDSLLLGSVARTFAGQPKLPDLWGQNKGGQYEPLVARIPVEMFPDLGLALEGLDALYLNSSKALDMAEGQGEAIERWLHSGGHLIVGVEDSGEVNATPWLRALLPGALTGMYSLTMPPSFFDWVKEGHETAPPGGERQPKAWGNRFPPYDPLRLTQGGNGYDLDEQALRRAAVTDFRASEIVAAKCRLVLPAKVLLSNDEGPLILRTDVGLGRVTWLLFSPERQPLASWDLRAWFWARLLEVPADWFQTEVFYGDTRQWGVDAALGVLLDSRQVRKLPVFWLLLLLIVYLVVIGPLDRYWLKRIHREMWTWITFPVYVVFFSLLIWFIGYWLRAGEKESNELQIVDVIPRGTYAQWRGRSYVSIYSPRNEQYALKSQHADASLRGELGVMQMGGDGGARIEVDQLGDGYRAKVMVPVWTSQLFMGAWFADERAPLEAVVTREGNRLQVVVRNHLDQAIPSIWVGFEGRIHELSGVEKGTEQSFDLGVGEGVSLFDFVQTTQQFFIHAMITRQQAFGGDINNWPEATAPNVVSLSFVSVLEGQPQAPNSMGGFFVPGGLDLTAELALGKAVVLAWLPDVLPAGSIRDFRATRETQNTLFRLTVPVSSSSE